MRRTDHSLSCPTGLARAGSALGVTGVLAATLALGAPASSFAAVQGASVTATTSTTPSTNSDLVTVTVAPKSSDAWALVGTAKSPTFQSTYSIVRRYNGRWSKSVVKAKSATTINAISAGSTKLIWAVGYRMVEGVETPVILRSTGGAFRPITVNGLSGGALTVIDASSARNAWALGHAADGTTGVALHWNGRRWHRSALMSGGADFSVYGVSTSSATNAWALGSTSTGSAIAHWNGTKWSQSEVVPAAQSLNGIATTGAHTWAVGDTETMTSTGDVITPLVVRWTAKGWKTVHVTHVVPGRYSSVVAVGTTAYAVGRTDPTTGNPKPVFATLHGAKGAGGAMKLVGKSGEAYVVAASSTSVVAVGEYTAGNYCQTPFQPLAEQLVRGKWKRVAIPAKVVPASTGGPNCV
jgi:hypothetical protein